ncbi:atrial natriuretic peptide receptor 1-like isoform X1 [Harmonia axyridis]|uniref:atrial natriuretic peptide receptor 1-like isoform X1 n=2 Tax=Harmonia axyridis TaxID=115357 RepID=UPI001E2794E4|nr:atrial natriuretic peptide receptor 1-like isoform X1 [Harmonia axyridis]
MMLVKLFILYIGLVTCYDDFRWNLSILNTPSFKTDNCHYRSEVCKKEEDDYCEVDLCKDENNCTIKVAIILPKSSNYIVNLNEAVSVLKSAVQDARDQNILNDGVDIIYKTFDDNCTQEFATIKVFEAASVFCANVIFGPICDYCLASVGRVAKYIGNYGTPVITPGGFSFDFTKKKTTCKDEFYMLVNSGPADFASFAEFFHLILDRYKWGKIALMYEKTEQNELSGDDGCQLLMKSIIIELRETPQLDFYDGDLDLLQMNYTEFFQNIVGVKYGIILICTNQQKARKIIMEAYKLKMMELGEYIFFNFEMYNDAEYPMEPWFEANDTAESNEIAKSAYRSMFTFNPLLHTDFDLVKNQSNRGSIYIDGLYDGMMLYVQALNRSLFDKFRHGYIGDGIKGYEIFENMIGVSYLGRHGMERTNCNGQRINHFALLNVNDTGQYETVAMYDASSKTISNWNVKWPSGDDIPSDTPKCGYDLSLCPKVDPVSVLALSLVSVLCIGILLIGGLAYRHFKFKREIHSLAWKINYDDIVIPEMPRYSFQSAFSMRKASLLALEGISIAGELYGKKGFVIYKSQKAYMKRYKNIKIELNKYHLKELKAMHDLSNENVVKFYGGCFEDPRYNCVLYEYCSKGTLYDVIHDENIELNDLSFRISLLMDIVRGMLYLHSCSLKSHGTLSSTHCLVDNRFSVKISDYGLRSLESYADDNSSQDDTHHSYWKSLLWTAPELLRAPKERGTQQGDIYSFAIIMHEIVTGKETFYLEEENNMSVREVVENVRNGSSSNNNGEQLRPSLEGATCDDEVAQLMRKCWNEDPGDRPNFTNIKNRLKTMNKDCDGNFVNNLLQRMEQYANNLEVLVEERTVDYMEEKRRCEEVLYQLLPKSVAQQLISGHEVQAENFDSVTIYFSDIVGFTMLAAQSTPFELVEFLNELYTCFDSIIGNFDVYKVETIGDAYMVVSGLPERNGNNHAREIARMSLAMLEQVRKFKIKHRPSDELRLRIGLHSGPCAAGVVGLKMPRYCLFGDTVCTASRMESTGEPSRIHVSHVTKAILDYFGSFDLVCRGKVEMKGKGTMLTYWLAGEKPSISKVPSLPPIEEVAPDIKVLKRSTSDSDLYKSKEIHDDEPSVPLLYSHDSPGVSHV